MTSLVRYGDETGQIRVGVSSEGKVVQPLTVPSLAALMSLRLDDIRALVEVATASGSATAPGRLMPPVDGRMEVWASGVTYARSRDARIEESLEQDVYERVYVADRPELFLKSTPYRTMTHGEPIAIRADSSSNVPEPEFAVLANAFGEIVGMLISNDVSSRTIEGENPLYLPQAKVYAGSCALSSEIRPIWEIDAATLQIEMTIRRDDVMVFEGRTEVRQMSRSFGDLVDWLFRADSFPDGVILSTGTGIVPELDFTLAPADVVRIEVRGVGVLENAVVCGVEPIHAVLDARSEVASSDGVRMLSDRS